MSSDSSSGETMPHGCAEGMRRAFRARDHGEWRPLAEWLLHNTGCAPAVAAALNDEDALRAAVAPARPPELVLGRFQILGRIDGGSFADVYRVYDPDLKRECAAKVLRGGDPARFRVEAEIVAALNHPNIVPVLDFGETSSGPFLVMPLMQQSLAGRLKQLGPDRRLAPNEAARLVGAVALGIHHAHQRGLIHRDLKPGNILLDENGVPQVADFGLAHRLSVAASVSAGIAGTPAYMAPEQARGEKHLTTGADVWALGVILFELLTAAVPFGGDTGTVLRKLADPDESIPPVSAYRPDVPADLEAICAKCLQRAPEHRYASAQELADDLGRFLRREPILARPRGLLGTVKDALTSPAEVQSFTALSAVWFGTVHHPAVHLTIMALVLAGAPVWAFGVMMYHLAAWLGQTWWFHLRKFGRLNQAERRAAAFNLGNCLAVMTLVPVVLVFFGPDAMPFYPVLTIATGLGFFQTGSIFAGRQYVLALLILSLNLLLPFAPLWTWPLLHALTGLVFFGLFGLHVRRVHQAAEAARHATAVVT